jgi:putative hydrolase of the HAD superfamily
VVIDLDDTLYPQVRYLTGAVDAVRRAAMQAGLDSARIATALRRELAAGSDQGGTIDRALVAAGLPAALARRELPALVAAFRAYRPVRLPPHAGVRTGLAELRRLVPVGVLTDGDPGIQWSKLEATGLITELDAVVVTDELGGRALRKPCPDGLVTLAAALGARPAAVVVIGDRPDKDIAVARAVGARSIRVRSGEYARRPDDPAATTVVDRVDAALAVVLAAVRTPAGQLRR